MKVLDRAPHRGFRSRKRYAGFLCVQAGEAPKLSMLSCARVGRGERHSSTRTHKYFDANGEAGLVECKCEHKHGVRDEMVRVGN
jgi:hypothetical protein